MYIVELSETVLLHSLSQMIAFFPFMQLVEYVRELRWRIVTL